MSAPTDEPETVIVYAGRHYGQAHRVIARTGDVLRVQFVDEVFEVQQSDTEPTTKPNQQ